MLEGPLLNMTALLMSNQDQWRCLYNFTAWSSTAKIHVLNQLERIILRDSDARVGRLEEGVMKLRRPMQYLFSEGSTPTNLAQTDLQA